MYKKNILIVILSIVILGPIGQFLLFKFTPVYNLNLLSQLYNDASWVEGKPRIAIMCSSHARYHIIPSEIAKLNKDYDLSDIVNIGENAASPFSQYTSFVKTRNKFTNLDIVYYTIEPHMLGEKYFTYLKHEEIFLDYDQWKYLEANHAKKNNYFFPFQTFVKSLKFETLNRSKSNGYSKLKHKKFNTFSKGKVSKLIYEPLDLFPVSSFGIEYLKKLKNELNTQGTKMVLVLTPSYSWTKYYSTEAKVYDDMLVDYLNTYLGPTTVIGSLWAKDFDLKYKDFKDDTHLAHSGAKKFTKALFHNVEKHKLATTEDIQNTFSYRFQKDYTRPVLKVSKVMRAIDLKWKIPLSGTLSKLNKYLAYSDVDINKNTALSSKFESIFQSTGLRLSFKLPKEELKMLAVTLRGNGGYAHFFIESDDIDETLVLLNNDISLSSKEFNINHVNEITIRLYPDSGHTISNFRVEKIEFLKD